MQLSKQGKAEIASYEGCAQTKYLDTVGVQTIALGATVSEIPDIKQWAWNKELTLQQCFDIFSDGLVKYENDVNKHIFRSLTQNQFDALVSIAYNIGSAGEDHSTFLKDINNYASDKDTRNAIMAWTKQRELIPRRTKECNLYFDGVYSSDGSVSLIYVDPVTHYEVPHKSKVINCLQYL